MCFRCVGDWDLKQFIRNNAVSRSCSFCGRTNRNPIAALADAVVTYVEERIGQERSGSAFLYS